MAAVGVAGGVGVVLEQVDLAGDALVVQALLGVEQQPLEDPLPRLVVGDQLGDVVALGRGVLRVAADVEVEPGAVAQEDVAAAPPADDLAEQVARHLVRAQPTLALERARDAVLVLDAEDPPVHGPTLRGGWVVGAAVRASGVRAVWSQTTGSGPRVMPSVDHSTTPISRCHRFISRSRPTSEYSDCSTSRCHRW